MMGVILLIYVVGFVYTLRWLMGWCLHYDYRNALDDFHYRMYLNERKVRNWTIVAAGATFWPFTTVFRFWLWVWHFTLTKRLLRHAFVKEPKS